MYGDGVYESKRQKSTCETFERDTSRRFSQEKTTDIFGLTREWGLSWGRSRGIRAKMEEFGEW